MRIRRTYVRNAKETEKCENPNSKRKFVNYSAGTST